MTPDSIKNLRLSLQTSRGRRVSQRSFSLFLGLGTATISRYELDIHGGFAKMNESQRLLIELASHPQGLVWLREQARNAGRFSDVYHGSECVAFTLEEPPEVLIRTPSETLMAAYRN